MPSFSFRPIFITKAMTKAKIAKVKPDADLEIPENPKVSPPKSDSKPSNLPTAWQLFFIWLAIGAQSFGGGATTTLLIRREMIHKRGWFSERDYTEMWTLCTLAPGINLLAFSIIIGNRLARLPGSFACLVGMLLPSASITVALTAGFTGVQNLPAVQAMLRGVIPAIIGISFLFVLQFAGPLLKRSWHEGKASLVVNLIFMGVCAILVGLLGLSAVIVLLLSAVAGAFIFPLLLPPPPSPSALVPISAEPKEHED